MIQPECYSNTISTVTEKNKSGLPLMNVLNEYGKFCNIVYRTSAEKNQYGCVETKFNISTLSATTFLTGNVVEMNCGK